jgi:Phytanoyl-CoA dioxygenase (PhyH)
LECADLSALWSAAAWRRFGTIESATNGCDKSQKAKAVTHHRTPKSCEIMSNYVDEIELNGFAIIQDVLQADAVNRIVDELEEVRTDEAARRRAGRAFGIRNLQNVLPSAYALASSDVLKTLVEPILGRSVRVVRWIYFDKRKEANWKVAWHQDLTIAVRQRTEADGFGPWSIKAGISHVQLPVSALGVMLMRPLLLHASSAAANPRHRRVLHFECSSYDLPDELSWFDA